MASTLHLFRGGPLGSSIRQTSFACLARHVTLLPVLDRRLGTFVQYPEDVFISKLTFHNTTCRTIRANKQDQNALVAPKHKTRNIAWGIKCSKRSSDRTRRNKLRNP